MVDLMNLMQVDPLISTYTYRLLFSDRQMFCLQAACFNVFIVSGGENLFMRALIPKIYGIPASNIIGHAERKGKREKFLK